MFRPYVAAAALALIAGFTAPASAQTHGGHHGQGDMATMEISTSIVNGANVTTRPQQIDFTFTPAMRLASVRLTTTTGETIPVQFDANAAPATTATARFTALAPDSYTLDYSVDALDHLMSGRVRFTVH